MPSPSHRQLPPTSVFLDRNELGDVESCGSKEIALVRTTTFTLKLAVPGMEDVTKQTTVRVRPLFSIPPIVKPERGPPVTVSVDPPTLGFSELMELPEIEAPTTGVHAQEIRFSEFMELPDGTPVFLIENNIKVTARIRGRQTWGGVLGRWVHIFGRFPRSDVLYAGGQSPSNRTAPQQRHDPLKVWIRESDFSNHSVSINPEGQ